MTGHGGVFRTVALLVLLAVLGVTSCGVPPDNKPDRQDATADSNGGLAVVLNNYRLEAAPNTFTSGDTVAVEVLTGALPDIGKGRFLDPPLLITAPSQPVRPVTVIATPTVEVDPALVVGVLWDPATGDVELLPVESLEDRSLASHVPHFSGFGLVVFENIIDLGDWISEQLLDFLKNVVFDFGYECPNTAFNSTVLEEAGRSGDETHLQLGVTDLAGQADTVRLDLCNRYRFVIAYEMAGAAPASSPGFSMPRSNLPLDVRLVGEAGDPFAVHGKLTSEAVTGTFLFVILNALPGGKDFQGRLIKRVFANPEVISLIQNGTRSCQSRLAAAVGSPGQGAFEAAFRCLLELASFREQLKDIWIDQAVEQGVLESAVQVHWVTNLLVNGYTSFYHPLNEYLSLGPPEDVSFSYRLRCTTGTQTPCVSHDDPPTNPGANPSGPGTDPSNGKVPFHCLGGTPGQPCPQPPDDEPCTAGDADQDGVCDDEDPDGGNPCTVGDADQDGVCDDEDPDGGTGGGAALPDLEPTSILFDESALYVGNAVYFDSGVRNTDDGDADGFNIKWYVNGQEVGAYGYHDGVPANAVVLDGNSQFTWTFSTAGTYTVTFDVDVDGHVAEDAEGNNSRTVTVTVGTSVG